MSFDSYHLNARNLAYNGYILSEEYIVRVLIFTVSFFITSSDIQFFFISHSFYAPQSWNALSAMFLISGILSSFVVLKNMSLQTFSAWENLCFFFFNTCNPTTFLCWPFRKCQFSTIIFSFSCMIFRSKGFNFCGTKLLFAVPSFVKVFNNKKLFISSYFYRRYQF